jgi:hypothetical protein
MNEPYLDEVSTHLRKLLSGLPKAEQAAEMDECESVASASGYLNSTPRDESPERFTHDLFADSGMKMLVEKDSENRNAIGAESPSDLVLRLMPSDGHLD